MAREWRRLACSAEPPNAHAVDAGWPFSHAHEVTRASSMTQQRSKPKTLKPWCKWWSSAASVWR